VDSVQIDDGILHAVWMSRDELIARRQNLRSPMVIDCIDDYIAGKRYPLDILHSIVS
jgi:hypothetical protein